MKDRISINSMHAEFMHEQLNTARKPCKRWFSWLETQTLADLHNMSISGPSQYDRLERRARSDAHRHDFRTSASLLHHSYAEAYDHLLTNNPKVLPTNCPIPMHDEVGAGDYLLIPAEVDDFFSDWDNGVLVDEFTFDLINA